MTTDKQQFLSRIHLDSGLIRHLLLLGAGLLLFGVFIYLSGADSLRQFGSLAPLPVAGAVLTTLGITVTIAFRWGILANRLGGKRVAAWHDYYHYFIVSRALGFILPKDVTDLGGRTLWLNQRNDLALSRAGTSVLLDRLFDLAVTIIFLIATLPYWLGWTPAIGTILLMAVLALGAGTLLYVGHRRLIAIAIRLLNKALKRFSSRPRIHKYLSALQSIQDLDQTLVVKVYVLSLFKFICTAGRLAFFALALSLPISPILIFLGTPIGQLSYLFAFTPGGLGIFEAGWFAILRFANIPAEHASGFVVGQRILTLLLIALFAFLSQAYYAIRQTRKS